MLYSAIRDGAPSSTAAGHHLLPPLVQRTGIGPPDGVIGEVGWVAGVRVFVGVVGVDRNIGISGIGGPEHRHVRSSAGLAHSSTPAPCSGTTPATFALGERVRREAGAHWDADGGTELADGRMRAYRYGFWSWWCDVAVKTISAHGKDDL